MKRGRKKELMLEDYVSFFDLHDPKPFNLDHLNAIIHINGFCKRKVKRDALGDLEKIKMIVPRRSTLTHSPSVYPCAPLTLDELKSDIRSIGWEECPIGSIVAVGSAAVDKEPPPPSAPSENLSRPISATAASSGAAAALPTTLKRKKKKKKMKKRKGTKKLKMVSLIDVARPQGAT